MDAVPSHILHQAMPESSMGEAYLGLLVLEVMGVVVDLYRGINHRGHGATPSWRIRLLRMDLIRSCRTYRHACPPSSTLSFHRDQSNGSCMREHADHGWRVQHSRRACSQSASALADADWRGGSPQVWHTLTTATLHNSDESPWP